MKSILQKERGVCYFCGSRRWIEEHHIYFGKGLRPISDANGFKVDLCHYCHNEPAGDGRPAGLHHDEDIDKRLKKKCQRQYEKTHTRQEFMKLIKFNHLWEDE